MGSNIVSAGCNIMSISIQLLVILFHI